MKITIEISVEEARILLAQEQPSITEDQEFHKDFEESSEDSVPAHEPAKKSPTQRPKAATRKKNNRGGKRQSRPVDVRVGDEWKRFQTPKDAAEFIGCDRQRVYDSLSKGLRCNGHEVRYATKEEDDEVLPQ